MKLIFTPAEDSGEEEFILDNNVNEEEEDGDNSTKR